MSRLFWLLSTVLGLGASNAWADAELELQSLGDEIYAIVGELGNRSSSNLGNNATFGFVVTDAGVVLIDSGGSAKGAAAIDAMIGTVTDKPVKWVINTGGQDHRWLGNDYFKAKGAEIVASSQAVADQKARSVYQLSALANMLGDEGLAGTEPVYAERTFDEPQKLELGGVKFELIPVGPAHTPGDSLVWLPMQKVVFTGDVVYVERMLGVIDVSNSGNWQHAFETMAELQPDKVVPGHGHVTTLEQARKDTYDYLVFLRDSVREHMEQGGGIEDVGQIDQSAYSRLQNHEVLSGRNALRVYSELEWE